MKTKIKNIILLVSCIFIFSCGNYLDVIPDNIPTVDHAFKTRYQAEGYLYGIFSFIPNFFDGGSNPTIFGGDEVWYIDPVTEGMSTKLWYIAQGFQGTNSPLANYWASKQTNFDLNGGKTLFTALSDCNIFLENIDEPFDLDDDERDLWIAEVKFLKAFYHFYLFRMYGPIPLIKENLPIDARGEEAQRYREPVDEVVDYIVELLDEAAEGLPETILDIMADMGRPTKSIALALKAQTLVLAASPLFNGNTDYASIVDNRGIQIFPQTYSVEKWTRAAVALKEAIDEAHRAGHKLYDFKVMNPTNAAALNEKTILAMQVRGAATERWNEEIIWGYSADNGTMLQRQCLPQFATNQANTAGVLKEHAATLRIVEQFYTKNGVPIEEDKDWAGIDPMELRTATADDKYYIQQNAQTIQLHFDREARFYGNITFDKSTY
ncbi:MAG: RagB/SusD family nutrient uptake outer membrane protein, partial [Prevotellaceae bacterium]|nr:RagB/SusD family nutrient uptake outer membrane protein [Prevotellaceae bacterium]